MYLFLVRISYSDIFKLEEGCLLKVGGWWEEDVVDIVFFSNVVIGFFLERVFVSCGIFNVFRFRVFVLVEVIFRWF